MKPSNSCILFQNTIKSFAVEICWLVREGTRATTTSPPPLSRHPSKKVLYLHLSNKETGSPTIAKLSHEPIGRQLKSGLGIQFANGWCYRSTHSTLGGKKEKHMSQTNFNHHKSCFSLLNCNKLLVGSLWGFIPTLKILIAPARRVAWTVGSDM